MFKLVCLLVGTVLFMQATPTYASEIADAAKSGNWDIFNTLLRQRMPNNWGFLNANVESLKPDENSHVYGHSISSFKEWHNDDGKISESGKGVEVVNNDGQVTRREFNP